MTYSFRDKRQSHCRCGHLLLSNESGVVIWIYLCRGPHCFLRTHSAVTCGFLVSFWVLSVSFLCLWFKLKIAVSMIIGFLCDYQMSLTAAENIFVLLLFFFVFFLVSTIFTAGRKWVIPIVAIVVHSGRMSPVYNLLKQI